MTKNRARCRSKLCYRQLGSQKGCIKKNVMNYMNTKRHKTAQKIGQINLGSKGYRAVSAVYKIEAKSSHLKG